MDKKIPLGVKLIGIYYIFYALALIVTLFTNATQEFAFAVRFGLPNVPENIMKVIAVMVFLLMDYGYLGLKKWGYWIMIIYNIYIIVVSIGLFQQYNQQTFYGSITFSILVLVYTLSRRRYFKG
ncbi:MAG: amino acid transporter [Clostridium sp.]|jgi:amino acid transporter